MSLQAHLEWAMERQPGDAQSEGRLVWTDLEWAVERRPGDAQSEGRWCALSPADPVDSPFDPEPLVHFEAF